MLGFKVVVIGVLLASQCSSNIFLEFSGGVGYPPRVALTINNQRLDFALNSASALLWVYDHCSLLREVECKKFCENAQFCSMFCDLKCCTGIPLIHDDQDSYWKNAFNASDYSLNEENLEKFNVHKTGGGLAQGVYLRGNLSFCDNTLVDHVFGLVRYANSDMIVQVFANGEMGLGVSTTRPAWFQRAFEEGFLREPVFSMHTVKRYKAYDQGLLSFGESTCTEPITWYDSMTDNAWIVPVNGVTLNGQSFPVQHRAILQLNAMHIHIPSCTSPRIMREMRTFYNASLNAYYYDDVDSNFTDFCLHIGGKEHCIDSNSLIDGMSGGNRKREILFKQCDKGQYLDEPDWLLGMPFFRERCIVHDFERMRVGIARSTLTKDRIRKMDNGDCQFEI
ncbi:unnamed protein product [Bursaphelenchus xylophilus]|nr:unnamed protein product [Bursaphelenchus xylophilus]CAG9114443.1 unnamed protein product [Bursaphelenchus xylophilus]